MVVAGGMRNCGLPDLLPQPVSRYTVEKSPAIGGKMAQLEDLPDQ